MNYICELYITDNRHKYNKLTALNIKDSKRIIILKSTLNINNFDNLLRSKIIDYYKKAKAVENNTTENNEKTIIPSKLILNLFSLEQQ